METNSIRISNLQRSELPVLWKNLNSNELNTLVKRSNSKEISLLIGHTNEQGLTYLFSILESENINKIFESLSKNELNKIFVLLSKKELSRISKTLNEKTLIKVLASASQTQRDRLLSSFPIDEKKAILEVIDEEIDLDKNYKKYLGEKFENSLEREAFQRIIELEEKEIFLERQQQVRKDQYAEQLENMRSQIAHTEKEYAFQTKRLKDLENNQFKRENDLKERIRILQEEHQKQVQGKIELKVPEFVKEAVNALEKKETDFSSKSKKWNIQGTIALGLSILAAVAALIYGSFEFNTAAKENIDWFFFSFLLIKGLIVVTLFGAWANHAYNIGNAYMHESLKRSDRIHAINFGKLYLEVYGNDVSQSDMKSIFENWNLESDSAFTKVQKTSFEPKVIEQVTQLVAVISAAAKDTRSKNEEETNK
ncbi:magnesium transporter MgtE N-terminal domain-containing protein [Microbulbifer sp. EKSA008]|uniref:magnesium transporter MgtE N-terminal domain-containing protein n=1 Tax=Microbulbifer sp. EKSA008 TaxID=3243367 RepID=UPI004042E0CB